MRVSDIDLIVYFLRKVYPGKLEEEELVNLIDKLLLEKKNKLAKKESGFSFKRLCARSDNWFQNVALFETRQLRLVSAIEVAR